MARESGSFTGNNSGISSGISLQYLSITRQTAEKTVYLKMRSRTELPRMRSAVECLKSRYDRPRIIQRTHVQLILDTPLKEGNGRELRKLHDTIHDTIQQHYSTARSCPRNPWMWTTWKVHYRCWHSLRMAETQPNCNEHYQELLDFIDMRAQALEVSCASHKTFKRHATHATRCKTEKHPLYVCPTFKSMLARCKCLRLTDYVWVVVTSSYNVNLYTNVRNVRNLITLCYMTAKPLPKKSQWGPTRLPA